VLTPPPSKSPGRPRAAGSLWNGVSDRPAIADPEITEFNQVYLDWQPIEKLTLRGGMHEITLGNQRLVGNVGWRRDRQSFAAKAELYDADDWATDTDNFWLYTEWGF